MEPVPEPGENILCRLELSTVVGVLSMQMKKELKPKQRHFC